jgi:hypothetical protein
MLNKVKIKVQKRKQGVHRREGGGREERGGREEEEEIRNSK